jgi:hypothetical protein
MGGIAVPLPCLPTECPDSKPEMHAPCTVGLSCSYEYRNMSYNEDIETSRAIESYSCSDIGWMVLIADITCSSAPPPGFMHACDPLP